MDRGKIAFLGVGNMANAVILANGGRNVAFEDIILYDKYPKNLERFTEQGAYAACSVSDAISLARYVFIAVKPQDYFALMEEIRSCNGYSDKIYISIGAGITVKAVSDFLECNKIVRALPNTPMLIGEGVSAICKSYAVLYDDYLFVRSLFESAGSVIEIEEAEMNRIIGVTSSSPAYVFEFINAMAEGAMAQGLDYADIVSVLCDVVIGSALLLKNSGKQPIEMIDMVASKGGTTEQALKVLRNNEFSQTIQDAMLACTQRADELGKLNK